MSIIIALILGLIQGLTEFLPVSSSGHLILAQKLFGLQPDLFTNVALHCGTLFAVIIFYKKEIWQLIKRPFSKKGILVILATLPTVALALIAKFLVPEWLDGLLLPIGFALTFVLLIWSDLIGKQKDNLLTMKKSTAVIAGVVQGISVLPGLSRSGSTVCAMKMLGVKNSAAVEMSFLMSIPVIIGSILFMSVDVVANSAPVDWLAVSIGMTVSGVVGYFSLKFLKAVAEKGNLSKFAYYMIFPLLLSCVLM